MRRMSSFSPVAKNQLLVTLVRHGETALNAKRLMQGQTDVPLSETGIEQAEKLGQHMLLTNQKFTRVYSSDLCRAHQTCKILLHHSKNPVEIKVDKRLRERCFGEMEGKHFSELLSEAKKHGLNIIDHTPKGGESSKDVSIRAGEFFQELCDLTDCLDNLEGEHALIVTHGGLMANLMRHLNSTQESYILKDFDHVEGFKIAPNTGVTCFAITAIPPGVMKRRTIIFDCINNADHLDHHIPLQGS